MDYRTLPDLSASSDEYVASVWRWVAERSAHDDDLAIQAVHVWLTDRHGYSIKPDLPPFKLAYPYEPTRSSHQHGVSHDGF